MSKLSTQRDVEHFATIAAAKAAEEEERSLAALPQGIVRRVEDEEPPPSRLEPIKLGHDLVPRRAVTEPLGEIDLDLLWVLGHSNPVSHRESVDDRLPVLVVPARGQDQKTRHERDDVPRHGLIVSARRPAPY